MIDFVLDIESNNTSILTIESSSVGIDNSSSADINLDILSSDQYDTTLLIESANITDLEDIVIEKFDAYNLQINTVDGINSYTIPDNIPIEKIVGNLDVSRVTGLSDFLDSYSFDCGSP